MGKWLSFLATIIFGVVAWTGVASAQERCPFAVSGSIGAGDPTQVGRLKNAAPSACGTAKTVPDLLTPIQSRRYDAYTLKNRASTAACVSITLTPKNGAGLSSAAYLGSFDPQNPQASYLGDSGNAAAPVTYGVDVPALATFVVTVTEIGNGGGDYDLAVGNCGAVIATSVTPNAGPTGGGTNVTVAGSGFVAGATVTVGGAAATNVTVTSEGTITATTPAGAEGPADVVVTNPDASTTTLTGGFVYVAPAATTLTLASSANPSVVGQNVTFTATATAAVGGPVTGSITFKDGAAVLGTGVLNGAGVATFSTSTLAIGTHDITAVFAGDGSFSAATSGVVSQVVTTAKATTTLTASPNPVVVGNTVTFAIGVTATAPATGTPSGTVTVSSDGTPIGAPITLDANAKATLASSALPVGTHTILATYNGDAKFASSVSPPLTLRVDATITDGGSTSSSGGSSGTTSSSSSSSSGETPPAPVAPSSGDATEGGGCDCNTTGMSRGSLLTSVFGMLTAMAFLSRRRRR